MVYRGKPAKGCKLCRQRRIKVSGSWISAVQCVLQANLRQCDLQADGCGPCARAARLCPRYRIELDALFVHQTSEIVSRHDPQSHTSRRNSKKPQAVRAEATAGPVVGARPARSTWVLRPDLATPDQDDFALAYCYEHHIIRPVDGTLKRKPIKNDGLLACLWALGMATYSATEQSRHAATHARHYYLAAISELNEALLSPASATQDCTLLTVIALSYFESILGEDVSGMQAWTGHVDGTAALICMRGAHQMKSLEGRILFMQATTNIISNCLRFGRRLPQWVNTAAEEGSAYITEPCDPLWRVHTTCLEMTDFYSDVVNHRFHDPHIILAEAERIDQRFATAFDDAAPAWQYDTKNSTSSGEALSYPGYLVLHQNSLSAQVWNSARNGRLVCNTIIVRTLECMASRGSTIMYGKQRTARCTEMINTMSEDILASVPQHNGFPGLDARGLKRLPTPGTGVTSLMDYSQSTLPVLRTSTGYLLVWCLASVGKLAAHGSEMRTAAYRALRATGKSLGIRQAFRLADWIEEQDAVHSDRPNMFLRES